MVDTVLVRNLHPGRKKVFCSEGPIAFNEDKRISREDFEVLSTNGFIVEVPEAAPQKPARGRPRRKIEVPPNEGD